jgi:hypothetical protein
VTYLTDDGKWLGGKTMVVEAHQRGVQLRLIQPWKPNQNGLRRVI